MHRIVLSIVTFTVASLLPGCTPEPMTGQLEPPAGAHTAQAKDGLIVSLVLADDDLQPGQTLIATLRAENTSREPIRITSHRATLWTLELLTDHGRGWDIVKTYPEASLTVMKTWTLGPGASRHWTVELPVTKEWNTFRPTAVRGFLNGRDQTAPQVHINVQPAR
jgi:hypothetical protein